MINRQMHSSLTNSQFYVKVLLLVAYWRFVAQKDGFDLTVFSELDYLIVEFSLSFWKTSSAFLNLLFYIYSIWKFRGYIENFWEARKLLIAAEGKPAHITFLYLVNFLQCFNHNLTSSVRPISWISNSEYVTLVETR